MTDERISFDLTGSDLETGFKLAPEGWAKVEIDNAEAGTSSNGNPQIVVWYKSLDDRFTGTVREWVTITKASINNAVNLAKATGTGEVPGPDGGKFVVPDADDLVGKELEINIIHVKDRNGETDDEGNVKVYANVKFAGRRAVGSAPKGKAAVKGKKAAAADSGFSL